MKMKGCSHLHYSNVVSIATAKICSLKALTSWMSFGTFFDGKNHKKNFVTDAPISSESLIFKMRESFMQPSLCVHENSKQGCKGYTKVPRVEEKLRPLQNWYRIALMAKHSRAGLFSVSNCLATIAKHFSIAFVLQTFNVAHYFRLILVASFT